MQCGGPRTTTPSDDAAKVGLALATLAEIQRAHRGAASAYISTAGGEFQVDANPLRIIPPVGRVVTSMELAREALDSIRVSASARVAPSPRRRALKNRQHPSHPVSPSQEEEDTSFLSDDDDKTEDDEEEEEEEAAAAAAAAASGGADGVGGAVAVAGGAVAVRRAAAARAGPECGKCSACLDKKKFGGPGTKKQGCALRAGGTHFREPSMAPAPLLLRGEGAGSEGPAAGEYVQCSASCLPAVGQRVHVRYGADGKEMARVLVHRADARGFEGKRGAKKAVRLYPLGVWWAYDDGSHHRIQPPPAVLAPSGQPGPPLVHLSAPTDAPRIGWDRRAGGRGDGGGDMELGAVRPVPAGAADAAAALGQPRGRGPQHGPLRELAGGRASLNSGPVPDPPADSASNSWGAALADASARQGHVKGRGRARRALLKRKGGPGATPYPREHPRRAVPASGEDSDGGEGGGGGDSGGNGNDSGDGGGGGGSGDSGWDGSLVGELEHPDDYGEGGGGEDGGGGEGAREQEEPEAAGEDARHNARHNTRQEGGEAGHAVGHEQEVEGGAAGGERGAPLAPPVAIPVAAYVAATAGPGGGGGSGGAAGHRMSMCSQAGAEEVLLDPISAELVVTLEARAVEAGRRLEAAKRARGLAHEKVSSELEGLCGRPDYTARLVLAGTQLSELDAEVEVAARMEVEAAAVAAALETARRRQEETAHRHGEVQQAYGRLVECKAAYKEAAARHQEAAKEEQEAKEEARRLLGHAGPRG